LVESPRRELPEPTADQRRPLGEMLVETGATSSSDVASALARQLDGDERKLGTILLDEGKAAPTAVTEALQAQAPRRSAAEKTVRVDVELLDGLVGLVGELVLARNQLVRGVTDAGDPVLARTAQRLGAIAGELQDGIMKTRMQAIDHLFGELPRLVRDLSNSLDKQVRLVIQGQQTELDRTLLEAVRDPVAHLVRNAVQHGIEAPVERIAKGKDPEGVLTLRAFHEGANVTVEVADDGAGLDVEWIASGMDDVKSNIERIGGAVAVETVPGQGAVRRLTIPETLAVIQALTVDCGEQRYVLPKASVLELVFIDGQQTRIEYAEAAPVYRLRGMLLPLVRLDRVLGLQVGGDEGVYVVVLQAEGRRFGLVVDRILNTEEIVVKALHTRFKDVGLYAGATILADGKVGLILDPQTLARRSDLGSVGVPAATDPPTAEDRPGGGSTGAGSAQPLLVTAVGDRRVAIPLDPDTRLAEFPRDRIQRVGAREVVQYEGQVLPLMRLSNLLGAYQEESTGDGDTVSVVVYSDGERRVALVVDRIVDLAPDPQGTHRDEGATGAGRHAASRQRAAELLDVRKAILAADPNIYNEQPDLVAAAVATRAELSE
jgi:two-component system chemotaxis sensor kinase CheA